MIAVEDCLLVLLAAGRSTRFGDANKLEQDFLGRPIGLHAAFALKDMPFAGRVAVVDGHALDYAAHGFRVLRNDDVASGMAGSLRLGVGCAQEIGAKAVAIVLADMPRVTGTHIRRLLEAAGGEDAAVVSSDGHHPMPPAIFGAGRFAQLLTIEGDKGARDLVRGGRHVVTTPAELVDIDTPADLERLRAAVRIAG